MTHRAKTKHNYLAIFMSFIMILSSLLINVQPIKAETTAPTIVSAMTDHIGKKITLTFDKDMADSSGSQGQFNVLVNGTSESVTSVTSGSDLNQVVLNMSKPIGYLSTPKVITLDYTRGSVAAVDGTLLESFTNQAVTNNVIYLQMVDFDSTATEIGYDTDTSDPLNPTLKYKYDNKVDYDNVKLAWYLFNGFFNPMVDDLNNHVEFYEKDSGDKVVLPNILTRPNSAATYIDGTTKNQQIVTDWYFWQIQNHAPLGLDLVSQALKPSTTYVIKIDKGFVFNNGLTTTMTYYFEFTTTADSSTKPCWETGSSVTASNVTENSLTLGWPAAQDNHGVTGYNIYKDDVLLTTVDGSTTLYDVSNLSSGTKYKFKVEAVDFANNHSSECLEVTQVTLGTPAAPAVAADDVNNTITGIDTTMEFKVDNAEGYTQYNGSNLPDLSGEHTVLVRIAAAGNNPAGADTILTFTTPLTIVNAETDHIGKKITLTFDRPMKDPAGTEDQFTVMAKSITALPPVGGRPKNDYVYAAVPVTSVVLGSDPKQIILSMSKWVSGPITVSYIKGSVEAADEILLGSFSSQSVTDNNVTTGEMVAFDSEASEIGYDTDTSDPLNPTLKFKYDNLIDYDNVQLAWYFYNGFPGTKMDDNVRDYVEFREKDSGEKVVLPNLLIYDGSATYKDGTQQPQRILTDWYFWQIQHYVPLGLNLVSQSLKPSTTYVVEIKKGFQFNNGSSIKKTYSFEFTTTTDSSSKPYWTSGSSLVTSNVTENSMTLVWPAAQDNHGVTGYNIYKDDVLLATVDGSITSYDVSNLSSGTEYKFKVEAVDFANNHSSECLEVTQVTLGTPAAPAVAADDVNNTITGIDTTMDFKVDNAEGYTQYNGSNLPDLSGEHTVLVRVAAAGNNPAGADTILTFTTPLTIVSAETDHIGKKITLTFDRPMKDPAGTQDQFAVMAKSITALPPVGGRPKNDYVSAAVPVTSVVLGSDPKQIILSMSKWVSGPITVSYTKGSVEAADEILLESFSGQSVTDNNVTTGEMVAFDSEAAEIGYDTDISDPLNPTLKFKYDNPIDYDNVQLAWYFYNGFPGTKMDDNVRDYVEFREKDSGEKVVLPNLLIYDGSATYKDGTQQPQRILTDWYFWQIQHYVPLGLNLVSQSLKPFTTYVVEIKKGFQFNNGSSIKKTYSFEFTTTADSSSKPYWTSGSSLVTSNVTENSMTLVWPSAQDNHGVTGYNIYKDDVLLTTVDGSTTSYDVSNLSSGTEYKFKVEAVDFANNHSSECLEVTQVTASASSTVNVTGVTLDQNSKTLNVGDTLQLTGTVAPDNATNKNITWSSSDTTAATVDNTGKVTAVAAGTATITVTTEDGSKTAQCEVTVNDAASSNVSVTGLNLNKATTSVQLGKSITLTATVLPNNATNKNVTWSSSNPDVATVDQTGKVTAVKEGKATITATTEDGNITKQCEITVIIDECFIATAAYGSKFQPSVQLLRHFRDDYLLTNNIGSAFVKFYYKNSPPIANFIAHNEVLKTTVRAFLTPFVAAVYGLYHPIVACMALVLICMLVLVKRKYKFHNKL